MKTKLILLILLLTGCSKYCYYSDLPYNCKVVYKCDNKNVWVITNTCKIEKLKNPDNIQFKVGDTLELLPKYQRMF